MFFEKVLNSFAGDEKVAKRKCINCNLINVFVLIFALFAQIGMRKIFIETESDYTLATFFVLVLIFVLSILNFILQKERVFYWLNSMNILLLSINIYIFLFKIIGL